MTAHIWFYERLTLGRWSPVTQPDRPGTKTVGGRQRLVTVNGLRSEIRHLTEVPAFLQHLSLSQLAEVYGDRGSVRTTSGAR
ncbi:hypothetical protein QKW60_05660 [Defluviimonas aestuarii]|uniref:hypothetical protein n=1 Tax=Albidovulum aestuarii TaxID=1130726 RepID=UPI00249AEBF2|nr:hypothetical protein [Defluviimonas aestuarii]MDI3335883.1 hypothetical protein [Defluviimonas aestuarii]